MPAPIDHIEFRLDEGGRHTASAEALAEVLLHSQRAVHLIAMFSQGREVKKRARVPAEIRERFELRCEIPVEGSYIQPVTLSSDALLFDGEEPGSGNNVLGVFKEVATAVDDSNWTRAKAALPDSAIRRRVIEEFSLMMPRADAEWTLDIRNGQGTFASFDSSSHKRVQTYLREQRAPEAVTEPVTLAGELTKIDFVGRKLTVRLYQSNRSLECDYYNEDLEEMLVDNRRGLLHVSGIVELDEQERPVRLTDVFDIREVDLSDLVLETISSTRGLLRFMSGPYSFGVDLDESGALFVVEDEDLGIHAYAETRDDLQAAIREEIDVLWMEYAESDPNELTAAAVRLRDRLLGAFELISPQS